MKLRKKGTKKTSVTVFFMRELGRQKGLFAISLIATFVIQATQLATPLFMRELFNALATGTPTPTVVHQLYVALGFIVLMTLTTWAARRAFSWSIIYLDSEAMRHLYASAFEYLIGHSYQFFSTQFAGTLTRRVSKYANAFEVLFDSMMMTFLPTILFTIGAIVVVFIRNHILGIFLAVWALIIVFFQVYVSLLRQPLRLVRE